MLVYRLESTIDNLYNKLLCFEPDTGNLVVLEREPFSISGMTSEDILNSFDVKTVSDYKLIVNEKVNDAYSFPFKLYMDITDRCQLNCKHCLTKKLNFNNELDMNKIDDIIEECKTHGLFYVKLGGGEPLLHPNIFEIIKKFYDAFVFVSLSTNAYLINDNVAKFLKEYNVKVSVSIEGPKDINDEIRGEGHYDIAMKALDILKNNGCNPFIRVTLTRDMLKVDNMMTMINLAKEKGVKLKISYCRPAGNAVDNELLVRYEDYVDYYNIIKTLNKKEYENLVVLDEGMQIGQPSSLKSFLYNDRICGAANRSMHINSLGQISPCVFLGLDYLEEDSNYEYGDIMSYWNEIKGINMRRLRNIEIPNGCDECERLCKLECMATRYYFNNEFSKEDPNCLKGVSKCLKRE